MLAIDDTRLRKTGRSISQAFYQRDPLSPPFHVNQDFSAAIRGHMFVVRVQLGRRHARDDVERHG